MTSSPFPKPDDIFRETAHFKFVSEQLRRSSEEKKTTTKHTKHSGRRKLVTVTVSCNDHEMEGTSMAEQRELLLSEVFGFWWVFSFFFFHKAF